MHHLTAPIDVSGTGRGGGQGPLVPQKINIDQKGQGFPNRIIEGICTFCDLFFTAFDLLKVSFQLFDLS